MVTPEQVVIELGYSKHYLRFVRAHLEAFEAAYLAPSPMTSSNELERLRREFETLPPRHDCTCTCPNERRGWPACLECKRLRAASVRQDVAVEFGRTQPVYPPMPMVLLLDIHAGYAA